MKRPIVCTLSSSERRQRATRWIDLIARSNARIQRLRNGVTVTFHDDGIRAELEEFVAQERRCCAWMDLELSDSPELKLSIRADSAQGVAAIAAMIFRLSS